MLTLYGIPNCNSVKNAQNFLRNHHIDFVFHDVRKQGLDRDTVLGWLKTTTLVALVNRRGTTWRGLDEATQNLAQSQSGAIELILHKPTVIKRPVLVSAQSVVLAVGFDEAHYQILLPTLIT